MHVGGQEAQGKDHLHNHVSEPPLLFYDHESWI
jgi:hypothetical protein